MNYLPKDVFAVEFSYQTLYGEGYEPVSFGLDPCPVCKSENDDDALGEPQEFLESGESFHCSECGTGFIVIEKYSNAGHYGIRRIYS